MPIKGDKRRYRNDARTAFWHVGADDPAARPEFSKTMSSLGHLTRGSLGKAKEADRHRKKNLWCEATEADGRRRKATEGDGRRRKATESDGNRRFDPLPGGAKGDRRRRNPIRPVFASN